MLRSKLRSAHVLHIPRVGEPFVLTLMPAGLPWATLGQLDQEEVEHPLAFASHKLSGPQCAWSTIEPLNARPMRSFGLWISSAILCLGPRSRWFVTTTLSSTSGTVPRKVLSCCVGRWLSRSMIWRSSTSEVRIMLWPIICPVMCNLISVILLPINLRLTFDCCAFFVI